MNDPRAVVGAFIAGHFHWNQDAYQRSEALRSRRGRAADAEKSEAAERAKVEYAALLARFCRPGFAGQPISYGFPPMHDQASEVVVSVAPRGERCLVKTTMTSTIGSMEMTQDYEYRLGLDGGRWYLESVKCVVDGRKYECL